MLKFDAQDSGLNTIHPAVPTNHRVPIFAGLSVVPKNADFFLQVRAICHDRSGFAERAQVFPGVEAKASGVAKCAGISALIFCSMSLGGILDYNKIVFACEF